jgi:TPR repeat protein
MANDAGFTKLIGPTRRLPSSMRNAFYDSRRCVALLCLCGGLLLSGGAPSSAWADAFGAGASAYARQDYMRSAKILSALAVEGDARAQTYLGFMYAHGRGVPQNYDAAARWMRLAAEQDLPAAQFFLGLMYDKGQGVPQDFVLAHAWLNLAAAHAGRRERDYWTRVRDSVASKMSLAQLAEARQLAFDWRPTRAR